jgi:hypothetical protein
VVDAGGVSDISVLGAVPASLCGADARLAPLSRRRETFSKLVPGRLLRTI